MLIHMVFSIYIYIIFSFQNGKTVKYSITLKVQPQVKNTEECLQQNATMANMHVSMKSTYSKKLKT